MIFQLILFLSFNFVHILYPILFQPIKFTLITVSPSPSGPRMMILQREKWKNKMFSPAQTFSFLYFLNSRQFFLLYSFPSIFLAAHDMS